MNIKKKNYKKLSVERGFIRIRDVYSTKDLENQCRSFLNVVFERSAVTLMDRYSKEWCGFLEDEYA